MTYKQKLLHLRRDRILRRAIDQIEWTESEWSSKSRPNHFKALVRAIVNQQLSGKAADTIFKRFEALFGKKFPKPEDVLKMPTAKLRKVGLSGMKVEFVKDLSRKILDGTVDFRAMKKWSDQEVIEHLVQVKGIGRWTAEMFLIFSLGRDDVFSYGDLALRKAMQKLYKLKANPTLKQAEKISAAWSPYRTLASRYLWKSLEIE